ncbi:MAG TPA: PQQ-binding-like beta-propeller repeat protein [Ignavibacteriaceae bacterium]|nr:PQQ-binding-like beta-propeller repeat protein [Ignavibacteriaceae bacterium]
MKLLFSIFLFSFQFGLAQPGYIAVITDPQIGPQNNAMNLIEVVADINTRQNITQVVVLGNITANGKFDEFIWAQEILDELTAPYFVVGGEKDYFLSEGKGSEISLLWGDDKSFMLDQNYSMICLNTLLPNYPDKKYIDIETLSLLRNKLSSLSLNRVITFSYEPLNAAENSYNFFEMTLNKKVFSFVGKEDKSVKVKSMYEGLYLNRKDGWGYLLISTSKDSINITKILSEEIKRKAKPEIVKSLFSNPLLLESKESIKFISSGSKLWSVNIDKTKRTSSIYDSERIYNVFKDGSVICLNYSGEEQWRFETNERIMSPPLIETDLLVLASDDGDIITLNSKTGNPHQIIGIGERISSGISVIDIEKRGNITKAVIVGTVYGNIYCYDLFTLDPIWTQQLTFSGQETSIVSTIVHSDNKIFLVDDKGILYCLSAVNGMLIWNLEASKGGWRASVKALVSHKASEKNIYLIDTAGNLFCVDALLGTVKWNIKNLNANSLIRLNNQNELILPTAKNKIAVVSTNLGKVTTEIELPLELKNESITDLLVIGDKILVGFSNGWVYKIKLKQKTEKFFRGGLAPIVSLTNVDGNCLITDYDGRFTLVKLLP